MICECGGILDVIRVEEYPDVINDKINYNRVCDVQCLNCGKLYFSQPYDTGGRINKVRKLKD